MKMNALHKQSEGSAPYVLPSYVPRPVLFLTGDKIPAWDTLALSPTGLYYLRSWIGIPSTPCFFKDNTDRFLSADMAWFVAGMHTDNQHDHSRELFHPSFKPFFQETNGYDGGKDKRNRILDRLQGLMFDFATALDRLSGSTTMIIRSPGTTIPGIPNRPEYLKAHIYLSPTFVGDNPDLHRVICDIVQQYIEAVGTRSVESWVRRARNTLGYSFNQGPNPHLPPNPVSTSIPVPIQRSAHYIFLGQKQHIMEEISPSAPAPGSDSSQNSLSSQESYTFEEYSDEFYATCDITARMAYLELENQGLEARNAELIAELADAQDTIKALEGRIAAITNGPKTRVGNPGTPSRTPSRHTAFAPQVTPSCTPVVANALRVTSPTTPTRLHKSHSPVTLRKSKPEYGPSLSFASNANVKGSTHALISQTLESHELGHLEDNVEQILSSWEPETKVAGLIALGMNQKVAGVLISISNQ